MQKARTIVDALLRVESIDMPTIVTTKELAQAQQTDEELKNLLQNETQLFQQKKLSIDNSDVVIYCDVSTKEIRFYVPRNLRRRIFNVTHGLAHPSGRVTRRVIGQRFVWPEMNRNITKELVYSASETRSIDTID